MFDVSLTITGLQEAQAANNRAIMALRPDGNMGEAVRWGTTEAQRFVVAITHVHTGTLRASHRMSVTGTRGRIYIDPGAVNPRSGQRPSVYGVHEHRRGGEHAFYERTVDEAGGRIVRGMASIVRRGLP